MVKVLSLLFIAWLSFSLQAQQLPEPMSPPRLVNDFASVLDEADEARLEQKLRAYQDSTSTQIAVVTVRNLGGLEVVDYATRLGEKWGVGQQGSNNGIVVLVAIDDRQAAIVTGYGLEGAITDAATRRIRENQMNPNFRNGNFYQGLDEATTSIIKLASGEFSADDLEPEIPVEAQLIAMFIGLLFIIFIIALIAAVARRKRNHIGKKGLDFWTALWLMSHMKGGGKGGRGGGSGWGGGGFGGGSSGGGFGGFGGGSFGGGGSGGSW